MSGAWGRAAVVAAMLTATAAAAASPPVTVGFGGVFRAGAWTPVVVRGGADGDLRSGAAVHVWAQDPDGQFVRSPPARVEERAAGAASATARVRIGRPTGRLRIELPRGSAGAGEGPRIEEVDLPPALPATDRAVLVIGDLPAVEPALQRAWQALVLTMPAESATPPAGAGQATGRRAWVVRADALQTAGGGDDPRDYDMFEAIIVSGRAVPGVAAARLAGIDSWVRRGGRLIVAAGASAMDIEPTSRAGDWLPGRVVRVAAVRSPAGIEAWVRGGRLPEDAATIRLPLFANPRGLPGVTERIDDAGAGIPVAVRRAHGLGTITWLGLDVDAAPFRDWPGTESLLATLLGGRPEAAGDMRRVPDLAGQLRVALERSAPGAERPPPAPLPFEVAIGLGLLYVLCLYPLDWWLVTRGVRRPWLAWLSLPAIVTGFTLLAWSIATSRAAPAGGARFAAAVTDIDAASGLVRGRSWSGIHAAANGTVDVAVEVEPDLRTGADDRAVSWLADAGTGLGGIDAPTAHPALAAGDYRYGDTLAELREIPIAAGATRLFEAEWFGMRAGPIVSGTLAADGQGTLHGGFAHHLPFPLDGCQLLHGNWLYDVGRLAPGDLHDLGAGRGPRSLQAAITRRRAAGEREQVPPWEPAGTDVERILEIAGLHLAAGGVDYTGLAPGRLGRLDLSEVAGLDRAVLVGTAAEPATAWRYSSGRIAPRGRYRIVIPVARTAAPARPSSSASREP